ncbi:MAG: GHKL domain-containing protein [Ruminococcus sp.]
MLFRTLDFCTILGNALDNAVTAAGQYGSENALLKLLRRRNTTCF